MAEPDFDDGGSRGEEQRDKWDGFPIDGPQLKSFQVWEKGVTDGTKLQNRENLKRQDACYLLRFPELSYLSSVLPETGPFQRRRESFERLSKQIV